MTEEQILKEHKTAERINQSYGKLSHCERCKGKGYIHIVDDKGYHKSRDCTCKPRNDKE